MANALTRTLVAAIATMGLGLTNQVVGAQSEAAANSAGGYPSKPNRLVVASAPGGGTDIIGRVIAEGLSEVWPQRPIVDNRAGSAGTIATGIVVKSTPDGYTLLVQSLGISYAGALRKNLPFDATRDIAPVVLLGSQPFLLAVHSSVPVNSVGELIQLAKGKPGQLHYGTGGPGGASHMATELLSTVSRIRLVAIAYRGTGPALTALLGGEIHLLIVGVATALPHTKAGKIKALGVTGATRSPLIPDIPTISEAGSPGYEFDVWYGMFAPSKTPRAIILKINTDVNRVLQQPDTRQRFAAIGVDALGGTEEQFARYFRSEVVKWRKVIQEAGIKAD
jgi:tripartite-type tricarboxylate transporter receptor subunit TctC